MSAVTMPIAAAAAGKPTKPIVTTQSGEKISPARLAPLYAVPSATGRVRTNHGDTAALTATPLVAAQPMPLTTVAAKSCHGAVATAHPATPADSRIAATVVIAGRPKRR